MPPKIFIIFGLSGAGKTTVSDIIAKKIKVKIFSTDRIRRTKPFKAQSDHYQKTGKFFPKIFRRQLYLKLISSGKKELLKNNNVILDATFSSPWNWQLAERLADQTKAKLIPIEVALEKIPDHQLERRLEKRIEKDKFAARPEIHWAYKNRWQSYEKKHYLLNNDGSRASLKKQVIELLNEIL